MKGVSKMSLNITEDLKKKLPADAVKALEEYAKETDLFIGSGAQYIPKDRFDEINTQAKDHKARADKFEADLAAATKAAKSQEELTAKINELTTANEKLKAEYEAKIASREREYLLTDALKGAKAKNPKAVQALLDHAKISIKDGKLDGLDSQLEALKKSDAYLFDVEQKPQVDRFGNPITGPTGASGKEAAEIAAKYVGQEAIDKLNSK